MTDATTAAPVPADAVPADAGPADRFIVVGVDGSAASRDALAWAAHQATLTGTELHAVMTWEMPAFAYGGPMVTPPGDLDLEGGSRRSLDRSIDETLGAHPSLKVSATITEGHPAEVLVTASAGAELLVVGARGHGAFAGMLLGSVSQHCTAHASCPVVVVRHEAPPA